MNECADSDPSEVTLPEPSVGAVTVSVISASDSLPPAEALWNQFLKNISQQSTRSKYPNPEVPEFYPRARLAQSKECAKNVRIKSELIKRVTSDFQEDGLTRYYWSFHDVSSEYIPRCLNLNHANPAIEYGDHKIAPKSTALSAELATKNQQLAHLNNVVKALLEEIWKINELSTRQKNSEQWRNDMSFAIDEFLKPSTELGFHCDDCCDRLKEFVTRASKQLEHKIAKQHTLYKNTFVDSILTVVENSLRALTSQDFKGRLLKQDVYTQTLPEEGARPKMDAARRSKLQITKVYRNRNFYKCYDGEIGKNQWYTPARDGRSRFGPAKSYSAQTAQHGDPQNAINPIQLIHQKYKNLNCRLEGIPDKNMVKFSYIVNGREYSAVASTKKEAQYHCAWHVLGAPSQE